MEVGPRATRARWASPLLSPGRQACPVRSSCRALCASGSREQHQLRAQWEVGVCNGKHGLRGQWEAWAVQM